MAIRVEGNTVDDMLPDTDPGKARMRQKMWHKIQQRFNRQLFFDRDDKALPSTCPTSPINTAEEVRGSSNLTSSRDPGRQVGIDFDRPVGVQRQNSEKRYRLEPFKVCTLEKRAVSAHRQQRAFSAVRPRSKSSPYASIPAQISAPALPLPNVSRAQSRGRDERPSTRSTNESHSLGVRSNRSRSHCPSLSETSYEGFDDRSQAGRDDDHSQIDRDQVEYELDHRWILNLSMHFRDKSDREKFFVTFAESPSLWRRVTISCDYRGAEPDSLETELKDLKYQRDKNGQIYESIRDSLASIQFYPTVTNLKLQTENGRLHVHVTEDVNEIIPYPPLRSVQHVLSDRKYPVRLARESEINFISHLSGFVYKVNFQGRDFIKKEIPGPDTVDEFLYEVNALHALADATCVIKLEAIVVNDSKTLVKGLLLAYASGGAVVDQLYDLKGKIPWSDRMRWGTQAIKGLSEIHEEGYVQGDFTLSNIVVDDENNAKIIDINRRGCPVGWEPPEIAEKIETSQRISMYISQKTDLYQLGMTLWALAMDDDEPERQSPRMSLDSFPPEIPSWFREIVGICLSERPRDRLSATALLDRLPPANERRQSPPYLPSNEPLREGERSRIQYIHPSAAVERDDIEKLRGRPLTTSAESQQEFSFLDPSTTSYQVESTSSFVNVGRTSRSRSPGTHPDAESQARGYTLGDSDAPMFISISPGREPYVEGYGLLTNFGAIPELSLSPRSGPLAGNQPEQDLTTLNTASGNDSGIDSSPLDLENLISTQKTTTNSAPSFTSESTPRDPASTMALSNHSLNTASQMTCTANADLVGLGSNPALDRYSDHEPEHDVDFQTPHYYDTEPHLNGEIESPKADDPIVEIISKAIPDQVEAPLQAVEPNAEAEEKLPSVGNDYSASQAMSPAKPSLTDASESQPPSSSEEKSSYSVECSQKETRIEDTADAEATSRSKPSKAADADIGAPVAVLPQNVVDVPSTVLASATPVPAETPTMEQPDLTSGEIVAGAGLAKGTAWIM